MRNVFNKLLFAPDSQEKKKYLITSFSKLNFKSFKNFIFADEYLFRLYQNEDLKKFKYDFANSINSIENFRHNKNYFFKKITTYRKQLANHLNIFHNTNYSIKYWGIILDSFLLSASCKYQILSSFLSKLKYSVWWFISNIPDIKFRLKFVPISSNFLFL